MNIEYTINFREDYKKAILAFFEKEGVNLSHFNTEDIFKLSLEFHKYQKVLAEANGVQESEENSLDAKYSSDMMFKWLNHLEESIEESIEHIIELATENNISVTKFPLNIELQLNIETRSFELFETENQFHINLEQL